MLSDRQFPVVETFQQGGLQRYDHGNKPDFVADSGIMLYGGSSERILQLSDPIEIGHTTIAYLPTTKDRMRKDLQVVFDLRPTLLQVVNREVEARLIDRLKYKTAKQDFRKLNARAIKYAKDFTIPFEEYTNRAVRFHMDNVAGEVWEDYKASKSAMGSNLLVRFFYRGISGADNSVRDDLTDGLTTQEIIDLNTYWGYSEHLFKEAVPAIMDTLQNYSRATRDYSLEQVDRDQLLNELWTHFRVGVNGSIGDAALNLTDEYYSNGAKAFFDARRDSYKDKEDKRKIFFSRIEHLLSKSSSEEVVFFFGLSSLHSFGTQVYCPVNYMRTYQALMDYVLELYQLYYPKIMELYYE